MMKFLVVLLCFATLGWAQAPSAAGSVEQTVRELDRAEVTAVLRKDIPALEKLWAPDFTVNSPQNRIAPSRDVVFGFIRNGIIDYASFDREIEVVRVHGNTVILMGLETLKPQNKAPNAGKTVRRRFTNIWMKRGGGPWQVVARHANQISAE